MKVFLVAGTNELNDWFPSPCGELDDESVVVKRDGAYLRLVSIPLRGVRR